MICYKPTDLKITRPGFNSFVTRFIPLPNAQKDSDDKTHCKGFVRAVIDNIIDNNNEISNLSKGDVNSRYGNYYEIKSDGYVGGVSIRDNYTHGSDILKTENIEFVSCPSSNRTLYYAEKNNGENVFLTNTPKDVTINLDNTLNGINSATILGNIKNEQNYKCIGGITSSESIKCPNDMIIEGIDYTSNGSESYVCNFTSDGDTYTVKDFLCKKGNSVTASKGVVNNYVYDEDVYDEPVYESNMFLSLKNDLLPDLGEDSFIKFDQDSSQVLNFNKIICTGSNSDMNIYVYDGNQSNLITSLNRLDEVDDNTYSENLKFYYRNADYYNYNAYKYGILNYKEEHVLVLMNTFDVVKAVSRETYNIDDTPNNDIVFIYKDTDGQIKDVIYTLSSDTGTYTNNNTGVRPDLETFFNNFCEVYNSNDPNKLGKMFSYNIISTTKEIDFTLSVNNKIILETHDLTDIADKDGEKVDSSKSYNPKELEFNGIPVFDLFLEKYYRDIFYINDSKDYVYLIKDYEDNNIYECICGDVTFGMLPNSSTNQA